MFFFVKMRKIESILYNNNRGTHFKNMERKENE